MTLSFVVSTSRHVDPAATAAAADWARRLAVRAVPRADRSVAALCRDEGVAGVLVLSPARPPTYLSADGSIQYFYHPGMAPSRIKSLIAGGSDPMVKAMDLVAGESVLDCTLGRASDAIVASWIVGPGGRVVGIESSPLLAELTIDGLQRYQAPNAAVTAAMRAIEARRTDHLVFLLRSLDEAYDVVYFDPLFSQPIAASSAMQPLRPLADPRPLTIEAVAEAGRVARRSVVVKGRRYDPLWDEFRPRRFVGGKGSSFTYAVI